MAEEISLTFDEKKNILDKILSFQKQGALANIKCIVIDGIDHFQASFVDLRGIGINFVCSAYRDTGPNYGRFGLRMVDIAISWGNKVAIFESGGGEIYDKIHELIVALTIYCRKHDREAASQLLG